MPSPPERESRPSHARAVVRASGGVALALGALALAGQDGGEEPSAAVPAWTGYPEAPASEVGLDPERLERLAATVAGWVGSGDPVGAELLVVADHRTVLHRAFGWRDRERRIPWERNTVCRVRSMTKPFVGTAIQMLAEDGRLATSDRVGAHLPAFADGPSAEVTIDQLLTHTGGFGQPGYPTENLRDYAGLEEAADAVGRAGPAIPPGERFCYSDAGSATLGAVVARVTGAPVEDFLEARIVAPLGLADTFCTLDDGSEHRARMSNTYLRTGDEIDVYWTTGMPQLMHYFRASGGMYSTARDYARFLAAWADDARGSNGLLEEATVRSALAMHPLSIGPPEGPYARHWQVLSDASREQDGALPVFGHGGSDGTLAWTDPERGLIVCYFTQTRAGHTSWSRIRSAVASALD